MAAGTKTSTVTIRASVPARTRPALDGGARTARVLGRFPTALYVGVPHAFGVVAVLTRDAVRLPCGMQLPATSRELPLDQLPGTVRVGHGALHIGDVVVVPGRVVSPAVGPRPAPSAEPIRRAEALVDVAAYAPPELADPPRAAFAGQRLLGHGCGLTPSGDDVLAGYLVAAAAYGVPAGALRTLIIREAASRTTTLSAALLRHAAAGEAIPQVSRLLDALAEGRDLAETVEALLAVGHSSGAALAAGVLTAARSAQRNGRPVASPLLVKSENWSPPQPRLAVDQATAQATNKVAE